MTVPIGASWLQIFTLPDSIAGGESFSVQAQLPPMVVVVVVEVVVVVVEVVVVLVVVVPGQFTVKPTVAMSPAT